MHTVNDVEFQKITNELGKGSTNVYYEAALNIALKWLAEYDSGLLLLTDHQAEQLNQLT